MTITRLGCQVNVGRKTIAKAKELVKKLYELVKLALKVIKMVFNVLKAGMETVKCVGAQMGDAVTSGFSELTSNPGEYIKKLLRNIQTVIPNMIEVSSMGVKKSITLMGEITKGGTVNANAILNGLVADLNRVAEVEPVVQCAMPMFNEAISAFQRRAGDTLMLQTPAESTHNPVLVQTKRTVSDTFQVIANWMVVQPWNKFVKPKLDEFLPRILEDATKMISKTLLGSKAFSQVESAMIWALDQFKKTNQIASSIQAFNDATGDARNKAYQTVQRLLSGKISVTDLLGNAVTMAKKAILDPLTAWLGEQMPVWFDTIFGKATSGLLAILAFVAEEILAEPLPFTQWGMEAIGSGICEPIKAAWEMVEQIGRKFLSKAIPWLLTGIVNALFTLPELGANAVGGVLDKVLKKYIRPFNDQLNRWLGSVDSLMSKVPPGFFHTIAKWGKRIFEIGAKAIFPRLSAYLDTNKQMLHNIAANHQCAVKRLVLKQECTVSIESLMLIQYDEEAHQNEVARALKRGFPESAQPHHALHTELLQSQDVPSWMHKHLLEKQDAKPTWEHVTQSLQALHKHRMGPKHQAKLAKGTTKDAQKLWKSADEMPSQLEQILSSLTSRSVHDVNLNPSGSRGSKILRSISNAHKRLVMGRQSLVQVGWLKRMIDTLELSDKVQTHSMNIIRKGLKKVYLMKEGKAKQLAVRALSSALEGRVDTATILPMVFEMVEAWVRELVSKEVQNWMPEIFDAVANIGGVLALPAATIGINVAVGSGSCATEWISAAPLNALQEAYNYAQTLGRSAATAAVDWLVVQLLNLIFKGIKTFVVKPLVTQVLEPFDKKANALIDTLKRHAEKFLSLIPGLVLHRSHAQATEP